MTPDAFVGALKSKCADSAVECCISSLESPPGRRPDQTLLRLSAWYRGLDAHDQAHLRDVLQDCANATLFGVLCVLDGVRVIEDGPVKSKFRLVASRGDQVAVLAPGPEDLHDILDSMD